MAFATRMAALTFVAATLSAPAFATTVVEDLGPTSASHSFTFTFGLTIPIVISPSYLGPATVIRELDAVDGLGRDGVTLVDTVNTEMANMDMKGSTKVGGQDIDVRLGVGDTSYADGLQRSYGQIRETPFVGYSSNGEIDETVGPKGGDLFGDSFFDIFMDIWVDFDMDGVVDYGDHEVMRNVDPLRMSNNVALPFLPPDTGDEYINAICSPEGAVGTFDANCDISIDPKIDFHFVTDSSGTLGPVAGFIDLEVTITHTPIPVPAALPLLATGIGGMVLLRKRRRNTG